MQPPAEQPQKRVKKEKEQSARKEKRQREGLVAAANGALATPSPARAPTAFAELPKVKKPRRATTGGIAWALSEIRTALELITDVEGVRELLDRFPECILVGGIAARREVIAALLGETSVAEQAAAILVQPGMRQPMAWELRSGKDDLGTLEGAETERWLQEVQRSVQQALGSRLKSERLRMRLSSAGCANLDLMHLPEKCPTFPEAKIEDIRLRYLASAGNLLVCLEPGPPLDLCRRFDPELRRTVLVGAAASQVNRGGDDLLPASVLCGPDAASSLEERFAKLCRDRAPQWLASLEKLELRLSKSSQEAREIEQKEHAGEVLTKARSAGFSFGRALQEVIGGSPGCSAGALTLEEELVEFASAAARGHCGAGDFLLGKDAASSAADLFVLFGGVEGYAKYLRDQVKISGADVALNGGAAWRRLLAELEVAVRLAHPPEESIKSIAQAAICAGGTGVHGHQRWEDVASKLMLSIAFEPILRRVRYVAARVIWLLRHQKLAVSEWMSFLAEGPGARINSPLFSQHLGVLRSSPVVRDLVFGAFDDAVGAVGEQLLKNLTGTLTAACINPEIMLRPRTEPDLVPKDKAPPAPEASSPASTEAATKGEAKSSGRSGRDEARRRVSAEMARRSGPSGGLPRPLQDRVFEAKDVASVAPVTLQLQRAFATLAGILATQAVAFADAALTAFCRREVDEAMNRIDFSPEQRKVLEERHGELLEVSKQVDGRLSSVRRCVMVLRSA